MAPSTGKNKLKNIQARSKLDTVLLLSIILFSYLLCSSGSLILARLGYPRGDNVWSSLAQIVT